MALRFNAGSASIYKWEYIGGMPVYAEVLTTQTGSAWAGVFQDVVTVGPQVTLPLAGIYFWGASAGLSSTVAANAGMGMSFGGGFSCRRKYWIYRIGSSLCSNFYFWFADGSSTG